MAYSCVRVLFEIGHEATIRNKKTPQGFTHDWELFVRGADNTDIHHFVDRVVFHLHESFHNPKRVVKEPPYCVRESGYAGFLLPIDIYLKSNRGDELHKIRFKYQLTLQDSGPPLYNVNREKYIFSKPSEEFRTKLIKGGGIGVVDGSEVPSASNTNPMIGSHLHSRISPEDNKNKGKTSVQDSSTSKKFKSKDSLTTKVEEPANTNDRFSSIFGQPIKTSKIQVVQKSKQLCDKSADKQVAHSSAKSSKHNNTTPPKKDKILEERKEPPASKEKEKVHSKNKKSDEKSSNDVTKQILKSSSSKVVKDEVKRNGLAVVDEKQPIKSSFENQNKIIETKSVDKKEAREKKHKEKIKAKYKSDVGKEFNEKPLITDKESDRKFSKNNNLMVGERSERSSKSPRDKISDIKISNAVAAPSSVATGDNFNHTTAGSSNGISTEVFLNKDSKHKHHKHKKDKVKKSKRDKEQKKPNKMIKDEKAKSNSPDVQKIGMKDDTTKKLTNPLNALFEELSDKSDDSDSSESEMRSLIVNKSEPIATQSARTGLTNLNTLNGLNSSVPLEEPNEPANGGRKNKKSTSVNKDGIRKHKKRKKDYELAETCGEMDVVPQHLVKSEALDQQQQVRESPESQNSVSPSGSDLSKFSEEYITKLKELQHKIMRMDSNQELQRIVQIIAETGRYEITAKTFDFDLCTLDENTVHRLAELAS